VGDARQVDARQVNAPHARDETADVGDGLDDLSDNVPHAGNVKLARGGRIEHKPYRNLDKTRRYYYVMRWEEKRNGKRYRPTRYIGKTPNGTK
jgi:hypothetical protein